MRGSAGAANDSGGQFDKMIMTWPKWWCSRRGGGWA